jgi:hypothetical protein
MESLSGEDLYPCPECSWKDGRFIMYDTPAVTISLEESRDGATIYKIQCPHYYGSGTSESRLVEKANRHFVNKFLEIIVELSYVERRHYEVYGL